MKSCIVCALSCCSPFIPQRSPVHVQRTVFRESRGRREKPVLVYAHSPVCVSVVELSVCPWSHEYETSLVLLHMFCVKISTNSMKTTVKISLFEKQVVNVQAELTKAMCLNSQIRSNLKTCKIHFAKSGEQLNCCKLKT